MVTLLSTAEIVWIIVGSAIGLVLLVILFVWLFGNIYNGLVRRKSKVKLSSHELRKILYKYFDSISSLVKVDSDQKDMEKLREFWKKYRSLEDKDNLVKLSELFYELEELQSLLESFEKEDVYPIMIEYRRKVIFSIPLYNANVEDYNRFRLLPVNKTMSKIFNFHEYYKFERRTENEEK